MRIKGAAFGLPLFWLLVAVQSAHGAVFTLTFEGLRDKEQILEFYNAGTGSLGSGPGSNYGVSFSAGGIAVIDTDAGGSGNFANEPSPETGATWTTSNGLVIDVAGGFETGFSFFYASATSGTVSVYDGLDATGNVLGVISLARTPGGTSCMGDPTGTFCEFDPAGVAFTGVAKSIGFTGSATLIGLDNVTFGSAVPQFVPEPASLFLVGIGVAGLALLRRRSSRLVRH